MTVSDLYKVIDDDTDFCIEYNDGHTHMIVKGDNWNRLSQEYLDMRIKNIFYSHILDALYITTE